MSTRIDETSRWRRVHRLAGRKRLRSSVFALNLTAMIDVVFLLMLYFLLSMDFTQAERALGAGVPGEGAAVETDDPFALPVQPVVITVTTVVPVDERVEEFNGRGAYVVRADAPVLAGVGTGPRLFEELARLRGDVLGIDQPFVVAPREDAAWEHAVRVLNGVREAGFQKVRFPRPAVGESSDDR